MKPISVFELNEYVRRSIEQDALLSRIAVRGEISGFKRHSSGHIYFTLKDDRAALQCSFFKFQNSSLTFLPSDGMKVVAAGRPTIYTQQGKYQLVVDRLERLGVGDLFEQYEKLKAKLESEGLFDKSRKRKIPYLPKKIGVVTSESGAVFSDILRVSARRCPYTDIILSPVPVQGAEAAPDIVRGLKLIQQYDVDTVIIGRGGGSAEDLWCFNDERVVRAVAECRVPVISAVGHETDYTLCDFAADVRAATPSHAAELAVPDISDTLSQLEKYKTQAERLIDTKIQNGYARLDALASHYILRQPQRQMEGKWQELDMISDKLFDKLIRGVSDKQARFSVLCKAADNLSPIKVLARGYAVVADRTGRCITCAADVRKGDAVSIKLAKGGARAEITEVYDEQN